MKVKQGQDTRYGLKLLLLRGSVGWTGQGQKGTRTRLNAMRTAALRGGGRVMG